VIELKSFHTFSGLVPPVLHGSWRVRHPLPRNNKVPSPFHSEVRRTFSSLTSYRLTSVSELKSFHTFSGLVPPVLHGECDTLYLVTTKSLHHSSEVRRTFSSLTSYLLTSVIELTSFHTSFRACPSSAPWRVRHPLPSNNNVPSPFQ
jgi:hypothetical protein